MKRLKTVLLPLAALVLIGCASFVNSTRKSLYVSATLADGTMKTYASWWKSETNRQGDTPALELQRSNVLALSRKVGAGLAFADKTLTSYESNLGTNTATKAVVDAAIQTALGQVGDFASFIGSITGQTNLFAPLP